MATRPYSTRFLLGNPGGAGAVSYTVPAGQVAIVRTASFIANATGTACYLSTNGFPWWAVTFHLAAGDTLVSAQFEGRQVLNAGDVLGLTYSGLIGFSVSGYLLTA